MNEIRAYLKAQTEPVTASKIRHALGMTHEQVYEALVHMESAGIASTRTVWDKSAYVEWLSDERDRSCNCVQTGHLSKDCPWPRPASA